MTISTESLNKLQQLVNEEKYSRKFIRKIIEQDIMLSLSREEYTDKLKAAEDAVFDLITTFHTYDNGDGPVDFTSKNQRYVHIKDKSMCEDIVLEVLLTVLPFQKAELIQNPVGKLARWLEYEDIFDGVRTAGEIIAVCEVCGLYSLYKDSITGKLMIESNCVLDSETINHIDQTKYLPPMIVEPLPLHSNVASAHLSIPRASLILKDNHHNDPINLKALNCANSVKLALNEDMLQFSEESKKDLDTPEKRKAHNQLQRESTEIYNMILEQGNIFYLTHKYDFRDRMYAQGYHINSQGTEYKKSIISLATTYEITD